MPAKDPVAYHKKYGRKYRKTHPVRNMSVHLGNPEERQRRQDSLNAIAEKYCVSRSRLFQMIADGKLSVILTSRLKGKLD